MFGIPGAYKQGRSKGDVFVDAVMCCGCVCFSFLACSFVCLFACLGLLFYVVGLPWKSEEHKCQHALSYRAAWVYRPTHTAKVMVAHVFMFEMF